MRSSVPVSRDFMCGKNPVRQVPIAVEPTSKRTLVTLAVITAVLSSAATLALQFLIARWLAS